jgi:hypothetical protein
MITDLPEKLWNHRQLEMASCAASGFECIAKLHGLIDPGDFPLQSDSAKQGMGFADTTFLSSIRIHASDAHASLEEALNICEHETQQGRFPLVSLLALSTGNQLYWHVFLCASHQGELILIDPAHPQIQAKERSGLSLEFERTLAAVPNRQAIHILTYKNLN